MATRKKNNKKPGKGGRIALWTLLALVLALAATAGMGALNASVVRVRRAEVVLPDLPAAFDGMSVLYATDIDLCGSNTPEKSGALFERLQDLRPDILLLGGDYTSSSLWEILNRPEEGTDDGAEKLLARERFFNYISAFDAPLGKYAIAAPEDPDRDGLAKLMTQLDIRPLFNDRAAIRSGEDILWLVGVSAQGANLNSAGSAFSRGDCVILTAYSPTVLPVLLTSEARDGGRWSDLTLCGHTHGGQVRLFGRSALPLDGREQRFLSGWSTDSGFPILVSQGVGCEGINIRIGSQSEVWLITLRRA